MPWSALRGFFFDQTYQSRYFEFGSLRASLNHGCSFEVWLTTRSMSTRMPRCLAPWANSTKSPSVP